MSGKEKRPSARQSQRGVNHTSHRGVNNTTTWQDTGREQFERILDGVYRQRWLVLLTLTAVVSVVVIYNTTKEPEYDSTSLILLDLKSPFDRRLQGNVETATGDIFAENDRTVSGELFVIQASGRISERVSERVGALVGSSTPPTTKVRFLPAEEQIDGISVVATSTDPKAAALYANLYAEEYVALTREASRANVSATRALLEEQERKHQQELQQVEKEIQAYMQANGAVALDQSSSFLVSQIGALEAQRDNARMELHQRQASLQALQDQINKVNPSIVRRLSSGADESIRAYQQQIAKLELDRDAIKMTYGDNPSAEVKARIDRINSQLAQLKAQVTARSEAYVGELLADGGVSADQSGVSALASLSQKALDDRIAIEGLEARSEVVKRRLNEYEGKLGSIPRQSVELARLQRRKQHAEQMYAMVVNRLQQMRLEEESQPGYARILRRAAVAPVPTRPNKGRNLLLGSIFGLLLGCGVAAVKERFDNRIYKPDELLEKGTVVLGVIPDMKPLLQEDFQSADFVAWNDRRTATNLVMLHSPTSAVAEAYRQARTNVLFGRNGNPVRTIVITGPAMTDGKTVTACNLAISLAQAGNRTLLIDADLRRPDLHNRFGLSPTPGLVDAIRDTEAGEIPIQTTGIENFSILASGVDYKNDPHASDSPAEMLGSKAMKDLLRRLKKDYDVILVDTPPILAATDAVVLSTQCDATLLVVRAGKTRESELNYAMKVLNDVHAEVIGAILNGFNLSMAYGYAYRYPGYTRYGMYSKYGYNGLNGNGRAIDRNALGWARIGVEFVKQSIETRRGKEHVN